MPAHVTTPWASGLGVENGWGCRRVSAPHPCMGARRAALCGLVLSGLVITVASVPGCSKGMIRAAPSWVSGGTDEFPADRYLTGIGQAESRQQAEERAYASVAKIFRSEVSARSKDWESFLLQEGRGTATTERRLTLEVVTQVSTDKVLENVRILTGWVDPRRGQHYALAGMDRGQAGTALAERIAELDRTIASDVTQARSAAPPLTRVQHLRRAVTQLVLRDALNADLRVIKPSGQGVPTAYQVSRLTDELAEALRTHVRVTLAVEGTHRDAVRKALIEGLLREGIPVSDEAPMVTGPVPAEATGHLHVEGMTRIWPIDVPDPRFQYVRWCSDFSIREIATGRVLGAVSAGGREGHLTGAEAAAKALRVMQQESARELARDLAGYIYGDSTLRSTDSPAACRGG